MNRADLYIDGIIAANEVASHLEIWIGLEISRLFSDCHVKCRNYEADFKNNFGTQPLISVYFQAYLQGIRCLCPENEPTNLTSCNQ